MLGSLVNKVHTKAQKQTVFKKTSKSLVSPNSAAVKLVPKNESPNAITTYTEMGPHYVT